MIISLSFPNSSVGHDREVAVASKTPYFTVFGLAECLILQVLGVLERVILQVLWAWECAFWGRLMGCQGRLILEKV